MPSQRLEFKVEGPAVGSVYPLLEVLSVQREFLSIFDISYCVLAGRPRLTKDDRLKYRVLAEYPRAGSYTQFLNIDTTDPATLLVAGAIAASQISPKELWENAKAAYEFLKIVFSAREQGHTPSVTETVNGDKVIAMPGSTVHLNRFTFLTANRAESHFRHLAERIEPGAIDEISARDDSGQEIRIGEGEKRLLLGGASTIGNEVELKARVFDFNTDQRGGKMRVSGGQAVPPHDYAFEVQGHQNILPYIVALTRDTVRIRCIPEYLIKTTGSQLIRKLWALEVVGVGTDDLGPLFETSS